MDSDATPIIEYTDQVVFLNDEEVAVIDRNHFDLKNLRNDIKKPLIQKVDLSIDEIDKGSFEHFMLKEIHDQPSSIEDTFRGRISMDQSKILLGGIFDVLPTLIKARRIIIIACGTSWHAGLAAEYLFEEHARVPVEVEYASEFRYRKPILYSDDVVIAISQSGETADTLAAIRMVREQSDALVLGICNVAGSSISRETDAGVYTHAGIEIGVASTKAFTAQITVLTMMAFLMGHRKKLISNTKYIELVRALTAIPNQIRKILKSEGFIQDVANQYTNVTNALYLGRGVLYPVALEGALKLKEISYIHAEGYPAAEMKHGPIALIDENMPVFVLAIKDDSYEKIVSNIQEVKARNGKVVAIVTEGEKTICQMADHVIEIPACHHSLSPLLAVVPLQIISYQSAVMRGCNVDQPRNLAKSVSVE
jgi:glucosamine--fructose-6-phosphate aminotransferase (isomerizing)